MSQVCMYGGEKEKKDQTRQKMYLHFVDVPVAGEHSVQHHKAHAAFHSVKSYCDCNDS